MSNIPPPQSKGVCVSLSIIMDILKYIDCVLKGEASTRGDDFLIGKGRDYSQVGMEK
jgi:hypothetical protein